MEPNFFPKFVSKRGSLYAEDEGFDLNSSEQDIPPGPMLSPLHLISWTVLELAASTKTVSDILTKTIMLSAVGQSHCPKLLGCQN